ncbi:MAG: hypothetical protein IPN71_09850 [Fibrobacteres bacterium]|nr:hypothetical protein [Fibrobacterota bacterium]
MHRLSVRNSDEWNLYSYTSDVECAPLSKLAEVNQAIADKLANSTSGIWFHELPLEKFLQVPSHILVVEPQSPAQAKHTTPAIVPDGRPFESVTDRYTVVETIRAKGTRPVPSSIEVRELDQHAQEKWSIANQNLSSFSAAMLEGAMLFRQDRTANHLVWNTPRPDNTCTSPGRQAFRVSKLCEGLRAGCPAPGGVSLRPSDASPQPL